jgi:hypothetical protein
MSKKDEMSSLLDDLFPVTGPRAKVPRKPSDADLTALEGEFAEGARPALRPAAQKPAQRPSQPAQRPSRPAQPSQATPAARPSGRVPQRGQASRPPQRQGTPAPRSADPKDDLDAMEALLAQATGGATPKRQATPAPQRQAQQPAADPKTAAVLKQYQATLGDMNRIAQRRAVDAQKWGALDPRAQQIYMLVDHRSTIHQVIAAAKLPQVHATYYLALLVSQGLVF